MEDGDISAKLRKESTSPREGGPGPGEHHTRGGRGQGKRIAGGSVFSGPESWTLPQSTNQPSTVGRNSTHGTSLELLGLLQQVGHKAWHRQSPERMQGVGAPA